VYSVSESWLRKPARLLERHPGICCEVWNLKWDDYPFSKPACG